ncbi:MAG: metalloregulator ArsR/SmtB family transcription factor [Desulfurococcaceae archaeon]|nr:metalloregulator ArsR/SmtB family transcription factor [Desulfurococcaceae archaeon]
MDAERLAYTLSYASELFKVLSEPTRLLIFMYLAKRGEASVKEIAEALGRPENLVSYHISAVKRLGIIGFRKVGKNVYYRLVDERLKKLIQVAMELVENKPEPFIRPRKLKFQVSKIASNVQHDIKV